MIMDKGEAEKAPSGSMEERIVTSARRCFERYGIQKTTIEDIAKAASVSRPTLYKYFNGKQEIVDHISLAEMAKVHEELRVRMRRHTSFAETVTEAILISVQVGYENPYVRRFVQELELSSRSHDPSSPFQVGARARWQSLLVKAAGTGELANDIDVNEIVSWLSLTQMMLLATGNQLGIDEKQMRHFIRRFVVEPLLADRGRVTR
jgi:AcrR family transcriptional regulator